MSLTLTRESRMDLAGDVWYSAEEAALHCGCHAQTIRKACRMRELAHRQKGQFGHLRIRKSELDRWMKRDEVPALRVARG